MYPSTRYQQYVTENQLTFDAEQFSLIKQFDMLYEQFNTSTHFLNKLSLKKNPLSRGIYVWGSVGIGKTRLMDIFFESISSKRKFRSHFHHFMKMIHEQLTVLKDQPNPLNIIAKNIASQYDLLCFDELFVSDIADAMILSGLFKALFSFSVYFVATSNCVPDDLYRKGFQRELFLPAIALIKQHLTVIALSSQHDYRESNLPNANVFFIPHNAITENNLKKNFLSLAAKPQWEKTIWIHQRKINTCAVADNIVWFDFNVICHAPRSQLDYLALAQQYRYICISNVPKLLKHQHDATRHFINLIDILYDAKTKLIMTLAVPCEQLYEEGILLADFQRTKSRLTEMQSDAYFQR